LNAGWVKVPVKFPALAVVSSLEGWNPESLKWRVTTIARPENRIGICISADAQSLAKTEWHAEMPASVETNPNESTPTRRVKYERNKAGGVLDALPNH
jgi:hypothetical protein